MRFYDYKYFCSLFTLYTGRSLLLNLPFNNFPIFDLAVLFSKLLVNQPFYQHTEYADFWIDWDFDFQGRDRWFSFLIFFSKAPWTAAIAF